MGGRGRLTLLIGAFAGAGVAAWAVRDYRQWRSLGPGGLPANWRGWLTTTRWRLTMRDALSVDGLPEPSGQSRLAELPRRAGQRPRVAPHPVPHRQLDQHASPALLTALNACFDRAVAADPSLIFAQSHFEKRHRAVTARSCGCPDAVASHGEVAHIHPTDGSMHMILAPGDARAVIEAGWGERHGLAGVAMGLPPTYTLVYAPRDERQVATIGHILVAAIAHMTAIG